MIISGGFLLTNSLFSFQAQNLGDFSATESLEITVVMGGPATMILVGVGLIGLSILLRSRIER